MSSCTTGTTVFFYVPFTIHYFYTKISCFSYQFSPLRYFGQFMCSFLILQFSNLHLLSLAFGHDLRTRKHELSNFRSANLCEGQVEKIANLQRGQPGDFRPWLLNTINSDFIVF